MNFQEARNLEGQKNAKGYQSGVSMTGIVQALVDPQRIFTTNKKPTQQIILVDAQGESQKVKVFLGNGPDMLPADVGTTQTFSDLAMNRYKGNISYMAFWDNMHPPQPAQQGATHLNAATQAIIDRHRQPLAGQQVQDHMGGQVIPDSAPILQDNYAAKEREKVLGMCFTNLLAGRLAAVCPTEMEKDMGAIAALWRLAAMCIDGTGRVTEDPNF